MKHDPRILAILLMIFAVVLALGVLQVQVIENNKNIAQLENSVRGLAIVCQEIVARQDQRDANARALSRHLQSLSIAYINHHGAYPWFKTETREIWRTMGDLAQ